MAKDIKTYNFCVRPAVRVPEQEYFFHIADLLTRQYIAEPFTYLLATEQALYYLAIGGNYTPYAISHKKRTFTEAIGTVGISIGQRKRVQIPVKKLEHASTDKIIMCKGKYDSAPKAVAVLDFFE